MKNKIIIFVVITGLILLLSCEGIEQGPMMNSTVTPQKLTAPANGSSFVITEPVENAPMTVFRWDAADYGFQAAVAYTVQITITGDFLDGTDLGVTSGTSLEVLNSKMNTTLLILGAEPGVPATVTWRVRANLNPNVPVELSDLGTISVNTFEKVIIYPKLYVPGDYQTWNQANENTVITSARSDENTRAISTLMLPPAE